MLYDPKSGRMSPPRGTAPIRCALMGGGPGREPPAETEPLIQLIRTRYHETHRREFPQAIEWAFKLDEHELANHLAFMLEDLDNHQQREEQVLFPMLLAGGGPMAKFPIGRMMAEHEAVEDQLVRLRELADALRPDAGVEWEETVKLCRKLDSDLREHMRLENEVLFPLFLD